MSEEMAEKIAELLKGLGYANVRVEAGIVYYAEIDGTEHRLVEDVKDEKGGWCSLADAGKKYIVTRADLNYCPVCEVFDTEAEAVEFVKRDFALLGYKWENRYSMVGDGEFPVRECEGGEHEWDIHEKEVRRA